jgi:DNA-binding transcriptional MocR family regulator
MECDVDRFRPDVLLELLGDWTSRDGPLYRRLAHALADAVAAGDLGPSDRLPSERTLAAALAVSRATVVAAYDVLRADGFLDSRRGSGSRIATRGANGATRTDALIPDGRATAIIQRFVDRAETVISLARANDDAAPELSDAVREVVANELTTLLRDGGYHPRGLPALREALAAHLGRQGLPTGDEQLLVATGASQALALVAQLYLRRGDTVLVESPSWPGCLDLFRARRVRLVGVPLDEEGIRPEALDRACATHRPRLLYVMPSVHNPTGILMSAARRRWVADISARQGVTVVEDNAYPGPPPIAAYASHEVLSIGSLTKPVWAGLRIGWIRGPASAIERLARLKALADLGSPVFDQAIAARLLPSLPSIAAARERVHRERLQRMATRLAERLPQWRWRQPDGGSALWIALPGVDARIFAQVAMRHGVEIVPGAAMDPDGGHDDHIRVPFTFPPEVIDTLVDRLAAAWADLPQHKPRGRGPAAP